MQTPLISIIMPCYNSILYIQQAVESVIVQTFKNWELLIIDDCSTSSEMPEILKQIKALDSRISIYSSSSNKGPGAARNIGISHAKGRYLAFLDSDDYWYPHKLSCQLDFMQQYHYPFVCTYYELTDTTLNTTKPVTIPNKLNFNNMLQGYAIGLQGVMIDTLYFGQTFLPEKYHGEDWQYWLQLLQKTEYLYTYPQICWKYRKTATSINNHKFATALNVIQIYREICDCSFLHASLLLIFKYIPHLIKRKSH